MKNQKLFDRDEPIYQPANHCGIKYREPESRSTKTGWFRGAAQVTREEVAALLDVSPADVLGWEMATDLEVEAESRADYGDY